MRVLLVGPRSGEPAVLRGLRALGMLCDEAGTRLDALSMSATIDYAAIVLDLPDRAEDRPGVLRDLRRRRPDAAIIAVGRAGDPGDGIDALDAGADDHIVEPVRAGALAARLRAVLRRGRTIGQSVGIGDLAFDLRTLSLSVGGRPVILSARERQLMELLLKGGGRTVTRHYAEDQLFGHSATLGSNAVEVYVHRLRRKLAAAGSTARIETVRGIGYTLRGAAPDAD